MKRFTLTLLCGLAMQLLTAQDLIISKDYEPIRVNVIKKNDKTVKFTLADYSEGAVITMKTSDIRRIEYQNGYIDQMGYTNIRKSKPVGLSVGYAPELMDNEGFFTTTLDYFVRPQISVELNFASDLRDDITTSYGFRYHFNSNGSKEAFTPFIGFLMGNVNAETAFNQIPLGVSYISNAGLQLSLSLNYRFDYDDNTDLFAEARVGWRFGK